MPSTLAAILALALLIPPASRAAQPIPATEKGKENKKTPSEKIKLSTPVVVILDSGIAADHPALQPFLFPAEKLPAALPAPLAKGESTHWAGWDFVENDATPQDLTGHGTHLAGLIARSLPTHARLVMFRTGDQHHETATVTAALEATSRLIQSGWHIPVVLCAFDYRRDPADPAAFDRFAQAFRKLLDSGPLVVCAAGNGGKNLDAMPKESAHYQSLLAHPHLIVTAACTADGQLLASSNHGAKSVTLAAPGLDIESAAPNGSTTRLTGSSQAAAQAAARAARVACSPPEARTQAHPDTHPAATPAATPAETLRAALLTQGQTHPSLLGRTTTGKYLLPAAPEPENKGNQHTH